MVAILQTLDVNKPKYVYNNTTPVTVAGGYSSAPYSTARTININAGVLSSFMTINASIGAYFSSTKYTDALGTNSGWTAGGIRITVSDGTNSRVFESLALGYTISPSYGPHNNGTTAASLSFSILNYAYDNTNGVDFSKAITITVAVCGGGTGNSNENISTTGVNNFITILGF